MGEAQTVGFTFLLFVTIY